MGEKGRSPRLSACLPAPQNHEFNTKAMDDMAELAITYGRTFQVYDTEAEKKLLRNREISIFRTRLLIAVSAGLALVVPMLVMTLHPSRVTSLVTTSVFVVGVAVVLAWVMDDAQNKDIVGATAAYAAVLVVFVGTGSGGG